jgi:hypothetical protein
MSADVPRCQDITSEGKQVMCLREKQLGHGWTHAWMLFLRKEQGNFWGEKQPIPMQLGWYGTDVNGRILPHAADLPLLRDESESESEEQ